MPTERTRYTAAGLAMLRIAKEKEARPQLARVIMAFKDALKRAFIPVAMAATTIIASPAYALEMGPDGCLSPAVLTSKLKAEGQMSAVLADRVFPASGNRPSGSVAVIYTTNQKGTKGYEFQGDKPLGTPSTKFCLFAEFNTVRVLDASIAAQPSGVAPDSNLAKVISFSFTKGFNPVYYGEKDGAIKVVVGNPDIKGNLNGMILIGNNNPKIKADDQGGLMNLNYSPNYDRSFAEKREMPQPNK